MALLSAARSTSPPIPKVDRRAGGARVAQLGLPRRGRGFVVCGSRSLRGAKKHRTAASFRDSVASRLTAWVPIAGPARAIASVALPASGRRVCASVIFRASRLAAVLWSSKNKVRVLLCCAGAPASCLFPPFGAKLYTHGALFA